MHLIVRALPVLAMLLLAGCGSSPTTSNLAAGPTLPQPNSALATQPATITPAALPTTAALQPSTVAMNDVSAFVDGGVLAQLSANDKSQAASAQFNALTFGRPGAPRAWTGDKGVTGAVTVGPYVRVNNIDCRDFTHTVTVAGTPYAKKGTACRDTTGNWSVAG
jgi:surface antigen